MPEVVSVIPPTMPEVLPPGTEIDRHVLDSVLRDGGMATIYLGHHRTTGARVAVKLLHTEYVHQPDFVARFDREAQVMGRLSGCPQIVSVHDVGALPDGRHYLVMDLIRGHDLRDELDQLSSRDQTMDVARAVSLMRDVAAAVAAAHAADVVHRDVKPSNIMLESSAGREVAKLLDFGISADLAEAGRNQDLTAMGTVIGTARYMAPEQAAGISNVPTVDIWGMGVVLLELLTGQAPPKSGWGLAGPDLGALPALPPGLRTILEGMLATDAELRVQTAREVEARLLDVLQTVGADISRVSAPIIGAPRPRTGGTEVVPPAAAAERPHRKRPMLWGALAAGVLAGGAMTGWWLVRTLTQSPDDARPGPGGTAVARAEPEPSNSTPEGPAAVVPAEGPADPAGAESPAHDAPTTPPEPESVPEPEPDPAPTPDPEHDASRKPRTAKGPGTSKAPKKSKGCGAVLQESRDAAILGQWSTVLAHTKRKQCWSKAKTERERLRVRALHKLGRYGQCEREGQESNDPTVWSVVELCRKATKKK